MKLLHWLRQPYPLASSFRQAWSTALVGGLFVTFFLFAFRPFGMSTGSLNYWQVFGICLEYGLVTVVVSLLWGVAHWALPGFFSEKNWTVWKEVLDTLAFVSLIAVGNLLFTAWQFGGELRFTWGLLLAWWRITFSVGFFPILFGVLVKEIRLNRRYTREAEQINAHLPEHHDSPQATSEVALTGDNQGEVLKIQPRQLLYCEAADNYVQVVWLDNDQPRQRLLRTTLRRVEEALAPYPQVYRCHRTYLVNLDHVEHLSGNAQGYRLHLSGTDTPIPVSRSLNTDIQKRLND